MQCLQQRILGRCRAKAPLQVRMAPLQSQAQGFKSSFFIYFILFYMFIRRKIVQFKFTGANTLVANRYKD